MSTKKELAKISNVFNLEPENKKVLAFITQGGHISGQIMKGIEFRLPARIEQMREILNKNNKIGDVIELDYVVFVVVRKHYNTKLTEKTFEEALVKALPNLSHLLLKTTNEDWPQFEHIIKKHIPNIEYRESSDWPY